MNEHFILRGALSFVVSNIDQIAQWWHGPVGVGVISVILTVKVEQNTYRSYNQRNARCNGAHVLLKLCSAFIILLSYRAIESTSLSLDFWDTGQMWKALDTFEGRIQTFANGGFRWFRIDNHAFFLQHFGGPKTFSSPTVFRSGGLGSADWLDSKWTFKRSMKRRCQMPNVMDIVRSEGTKTWHCHLYVPVTYDFIGFQALEHGSWRKW